MHTHQRFYLTHELMRGQVTGCSRFKDFREPRAGSEFRASASRPIRARFLHSTQTRCLCISMDKNHLHYPHFSTIKTCQNSSKTSKAEARQDTQSWLFAHLCLL